MRNFTLIILMLIASLSFAQKTPITFESGENGANWTWSTFENDTNPAVEIVANPSESGINTSSKVAKFTALKTGQPWAGCESLHGTTDLGPFTLDATNSLIKIMVYKTVISDVGIKLIANKGWAQTEIKVANTKVNEWEELTFNFSAYTNPPADQGQYDQIVIFPDFKARDQDNIVYFDNISFNPAPTATDIPTVAAPTPPSRDAANVISLFSDAYTNVTVNSWRTDWSAAVLTDINIEGNATKKYSNLDFVGIETTSNPLNIEEMTHLHIDVWSPNFTKFSVKLVDFGVNGVYGGGDDTEHQLNFESLAQNEWVKLEIPLSDFTNLTGKGHIAQYILVGQPTGSTTLYLDNFYFYKAGSEPTEGPNAPVDFETNGFGANWTWSTFENGSNPALEVMANPNSSGINTSAKVAKFTALQGGQPWAGCESLHGTTDLGPFTLDATNSLIKIMVYKTVISDVGIKLVANSGWAQPEIKVANTKVNEWEELTFSFEGFPNPPTEEGKYDQIVVFPDFNLSGRTQDNIIYFDNITFNAQTGGTPPSVPVGLVASNMIGPNPVNSGEVFLAVGPNSVGGNIVYKLFYSKTSEAPSDPKTATQYTFGTTAGDGGGINAFGFVLGNLEPATSYSFWLYQYKVDESLYSNGFATATAVSGGGTATNPTVGAPTPPSRDAANVISIFSNAYSNVEGTEFNPGWGQATQYSVVEIEGNQTIKYDNFNYQGTQFANALDVSSMDKLHLDMWTSNATVVNIFCVSTGPVETAFSLPITPNQWVSYDIPVTAFANVNMSDLIQFKFDGGNGSQTIYLDNLYFYKSGTEPTEGPNAPVDFETNGFGANWTWNVFENDTNPAVEIVANPSESGINTSSKVAKFTALKTGQPWAGSESLHGTTDLGPFTLDATNSLIKIMVYKTVISNVGIKLVANSGWAQIEIKVANTKVNEWEELSFDFSAYPNPPDAEGKYDQIVVFPDFDLGGRAQDNIIYFDNITFNPAAPSNDIPTVAAPIPTHATGDVISLFSDAYTNVTVDTWRTDWSAAILSNITVDGNATKRYTNLDFVGIETTSNTLNIAEMTHLHIDIWSPNFTKFSVKLVDFGANGVWGGGDDTEHQVNFESLAQKEWVKLDIPISSFANLTGKEHIAQYILVGQPSGTTTVYVDNFYFYKEGGSEVEEPTTAAPTPTVIAEKVISLFSNAYTNVTVDTWRTDWSAATLTDVSVDGNATKKYSNLDFVGIETTSSPLNIAGMTRLHIDIWSPNFTNFSVKLVDFGANGVWGGGDDTEHQVNFATLAQKEWVSIDIPLSDFTNLTGREHIAQYILVGQPSGTSILYVDNFYFYNDTNTSSDLNPLVNIVKAFPNPVKLGQQLKLSTEVSKVQIFDLIGRSIISLNSTSVINTDALNQGIYIVKVYPKQGKAQTIKLIVN
jgi:hypothetical protein